jgi:predicted methyltransferase
MHWTPTARLWHKTPMAVPLLTREVQDGLQRAAAAGGQQAECSLDLGRSRVVVAVDPAGWHWQDRHHRWLDPCRERTVYHLADAGFEPVARYDGALVKLVPTDWGPPTFEIDGIKMLPTSQVSPWDDARRKVALVEPAGKRILDTCGGLGYFAAQCLAAGAREVRSFEKNPSVAWLRTLNPWSPVADGVRLVLEPVDFTTRLAAFDDGSFGAILHDPPRFGIAGELYSQQLYDTFARLLGAGGRLFHYTGTPNRLTSNRDLPREVATRLQRAGFATQLVGDGVLATRGATRAGGRRSAERGRRKAG